jgi:uncharacterized protein (TIGR00661 family)
MDNRQKKKRVLVAPLDWGIGHATRMVPIILHLQNAGVEVILAADGNSYDFLKSYFPNTQLIRLKGYQIRYSGSKFFFVPIMLIQIPKIIIGIKREQKDLQKIIKEQKIDAVISDNRFGLHSPKIPDVFVTHQIYIKMPAGLSFLEPLVFFINRYFFSKYSEIWIPDFQEPNSIAGELTHKKPLPEARFLGSLSRFEKKDPIPDGKKWDILVLLSGPEPQRSILEKIIIQQTQSTNLKTLILQGKPSAAPPPSPSPNIQIMAHASDQEIYTFIKQSKYIFCRSGYSTIMDLIALRSKAIFIPTPGQTEQEYLANRFKKKGICNCYPQSQLSITQAIAEDIHYSGFSSIPQASAYRTVIDSFIKRI